MTIPHYRTPLVLAAFGLVLFVVGLSAAVSTGWKAAGLCLLAAPAAAAQGFTAPNVVLVITDDQGYGDLGVHGNPRISTPNLDRLARESVGFRSFYVSPVCSPTRASLITGRYNYARASSTRISAAR